MSNAGGASLDIQMLRWQQEVYTSDVRFQVIAAGRRCGKSRYAAYRLLLSALDGKPGETWYVGLTQGNARDVMWNTFHEIARPVIKSSHINNLQITLINGAVVSLKGSDRPDTMRGASLKLCVMDEYGFMRESVWSEIIRPALADRKGKAIFIGTPAGRNHFYDLAQYAEKAGDPDWGYWHFTSYDNETLDPNEIDAAKRSLSTHVFNQEFRASFNARESELFKDDWLQFAEDDHRIGDYYIAIDLAGFQEGATKNKRLDESAIAVVKVMDDGEWFVEEIRHGRWGFDETVRNIFHTVQKYKPLSVGIEKGIAKQAVMSPLMDMMSRHGLFFRIEELTHGNQNKANRVVHALQGRFEHGKITLKQADWNLPFIDQLMQFPSSMTHDDLVDALAYIDQLAKVCYNTNIEIDEWEAYDPMAGY